MVAGKRTILIIRRLAMNGSAKWLYDTDVLIDYLKGKEEASQIVNYPEQVRLVSVITVAELISGVRNEKENAALLGFLEHFTIIEISDAIARLGGQLRREYLKSHQLRLPDALIAACVIKEGAELKTLNTKDYPMFNDLVPAYRK